MHESLDKAGFTVGLWYLDGLLLDIQWPIAAASREMTTQPVIVYKAQSGTVYLGFSIVSS